MISRMRSLFVGLSIAVAMGAGAQAQTSKPPVVAAAADLKFALDDIAAEFKTDTGQEVKLTYGSSGNFTRQLLEGAPFEIFLSADESYVFQLADAGKTADRGVLYAEGRIVLFAPKGSAVKADAEFTDLRAALADGRLQKFAIANPEHAPYGRAAQQALKHADLWDAIQPKIVLGENVAQTAQFASSGSTQGGIFAYSLALSPAIAALGDYVLVPAEWHDPLKQRMVLMKDAGDGAKAFYAYIRTPAARTLFGKYGFVLPGEGS